MQRAGGSQRRPRDAPGAGGGRSPPGGSYRGVGGGTRVGPPARTCGFSCCPSSSCEAPPMVFQRSFPIVPPTSARSPRAPAPARPAPRTPHREGGTGGGGGGGKGGRRRRRTRARTRGWALPPSPPAPPAPLPPPLRPRAGGRGRAERRPQTPPETLVGSPRWHNPPLSTPSPAAPSAPDSLRNHSGFAPVSLRIRSRSRYAGIAGGAAAGKAVWGCSGGKSWPFTPSTWPQSWGQHFVFMGLSITVPLGWVCPQWEEGSGQGRGTLGSAPPAGKHWKHRPKP